MTEQTIAVINLWCVENKILQFTNTYFALAEVILGAVFLVDMVRDGRVFVFADNLEWIFTAKTQNTFIKYSVFRYIKTCDMIKNYLTLYNSDCTFSVAFE